LSPRSSVSMAWQVMRETRNSSGGSDLLVRKPAKEGGKWTTQRTHKDVE
jgi:hypothetical protein